MVLHFQFSLSVLDPSLNLITPSQDLVTQDRILLEAAGLSLRGGRALDVPITKAELANGTDVFAPGAELALEQPTDDPSGTFKSRSGDLCVFLRDKAASNVEGEHLVKYLSLPPHNVKRETNEDKKERHLENDITEYKAATPSDHGQTVPDGMQAYGGSVAEHWEKYLHKIVVRLPRDTAADAGHRRERGVGERGKDTAKGEQDHEALDSCRGNAESFRRVSNASAVIQDVFNGRESERDHTGIDDAVQYVVEIPAKKHKEQQHAEALGGFPRQISIMRKELSDLRPRVPPR